MLNLLFASVIYMMVVLNLINVIKKVENNLKTKQPLLYSDIHKIHFNSVSRSS